MKVLIAVDLQRDFIDGALGTAEAQAVVPASAARLRAFRGRVFLTRDTHEACYLTTEEGRHLPVPHCIRGSDGWQLHPEIAAAAPPDAEIIDKPTFGSTVLGERLRALNAAEPIESVTLMGLCTDICVISNALLVKAFLPETPVAVIASCCAGVTPESHARALAAMRMCQIEIEA